MSDLYIHVPPFGFDSLTSRNFDTVNDDVIELTKKAIQYKLNIVYAISVSRLLQTCTNISLKCNNSLSLGTFCLFYSNL